MGLKPGHLVVAKKLTEINIRGRNEHIETYRDRNDNIIFKINN